MAKSMQLHADVKCYDYNGVAVHFRNVDGDVYIPVVDARNLLMVGSGLVPIYEMCASVNKIVFYNNGRALTSILPCDLENLARKGTKSKIDKKQTERIAWLRGVCKQIKGEESTPEEALKIFSHPDFGNIRSVSSEDGPLFCLADICKTLELTNPRQVKARLDVSDTQLIDLHAVTFGYADPSVGNTMATFINEPALYEVILRSDSPKAKPFRKWVTREVLPSIRKTGGYVVATPDDTPEIVMARGLMAAKEALDRMEQRAIAAESNLALATPKVEYYDTVITDREYYSTYQIAAELGMSYPTLRLKLVKNGLVSSATGALTVTPEYRHCGTSERTTAKRGRVGFKWNHEGRNVIFSLIAPTMPK